MRLIFINLHFYCNRFSGPKTPYVNKLVEKAIKQQEKRSQYALRCVLGCNSNSFLQLLLFSCLFYMNFVLYW